MSPEQAAERKEATLRESQLGLYHSLQETLDQVGKEMLGNTKWRTDQVDRSLEELLDEINNHFGSEG